MNQTLEAFHISDHPAATMIGTRAVAGTGPSIVARSPIDGGTLATVASATAADVDSAIDAAHAAFLKLRVIPAPARGELVRRIGVKLRERKAELAELVTLEAGKITSESLGEVQEMIDICDFAVGLSAPASRPDDRQRTAGPPHDGAVPPARRRRRDQRIQLPRRRLGVERDARPRVRRQRSSGSRARRRR